MKVRWLALTSSFIILTSSFSVRPASPVISDLLGNPWSGQPARFFQSAGIAGSFLSRCTAVSPEPALADFHSVGVRPSRTLQRGRHLMQTHQRMSPLHSILMPRPTSPVWLDSVGFGLPRRSPTKAGRIYPDSVWPALTPCYPTRVRD